MIEGPWSLERIDLVRQRRLAETTRRLIMDFLSPPWLRAPRRLSPTPGGSLRTSTTSAFPTQGAIDELLADSEPTLRDYVCYVLLDFVTADRDLTEPALASRLELCRRLDIVGRFGEVVVKELGLAKKQFAKLERDAAAMVAQLQKAHETAQKT